MPGCGGHNCSADLGDTSTIPRFPFLCRLGRLWMLKADRGPRCVQSESAT